MKLQIKKYIVDELIRGSEEVLLEDDDDLLLGNMLDSLGVMRLVEYLEGLNDIKIPPEDITLEHFQSVNKISDYLSGASGRLPMTGTNEV